MEAGIEADSEMGAARGGKVQVKGEEKEAEVDGLEARLAKLKEF